MKFQQHSSHFVTRHEIIREENVISEMVIIHVAQTSEVARRNRLCLHLMSFATLMGDDIDVC